MQTSLVAALRSCQISAHLCVSLSADHHVESEDDLDCVELTLGLLLRLALLDAAVRCQLSAQLPLLLSWLGTAADRPQLLLLILSLLNVVMAGQLAEDDQQLPNLGDCSSALEQLLQSNQPEVLNKALVARGLLNLRNSQKLSEDSVKNLKSRTDLKDSVTQQRIQFAALQL